MSCPIQTTKLAVCQTIIARYCVFHVPLWRWACFPLDRDRGTPSSAPQTRRNRDMHEHKNNNVREFGRYEIRMRDGIGPAEPVNNKYLIQTYPVWAALRGATGRSGRIIARARYWPGTRRMRYVQNIGYVKHGPRRIGRVRRNTDEIGIINGSICATCRKVLGGDEESTDFLEEYFFSISTSKMSYIILKVNSFLYFNECYIWQIFQRFCEKSQKAIPWKCSDRNMGGWGVDRTSAMLNMSLGG